MFTGSEYGLAAGVLYSGMIAAACASDVRSRRIPNKLVAVLSHKVKHNSRMVMEAHKVHSKVKM